MRNKRLNRIIQAADDLELDAPVQPEVSADETDQILDDDANEFVGDADDGQYTDEDVQEHVQNLAAQQRDQINQSRRRGMAPARGQHGRHRTAARREAASRIPHKTNAVVWQPAFALDAPPPQPGMEQRWVRFQNGEKNDPRNWSRRTRERWVPRNLETVPEDFSPPTLTHGQLGNVIAIGDLILCERKLEIGQARRRFYRERAARQQSSAVKGKLAQVQRADHPISVTIGRDKAPTIGRGRRVTAQADE